MFSGRDKSAKELYQIYINTLKNGYPYGADCFIQSNFTTDGQPQTITYYKGGLANATTPNTGAIKLAIVTQYYANGAAGGNLISASVNTTSVG